jgi:hypothetical protein
MTIKLIPPVKINQFDEMDMLLLVKADECPVNQRLFWHFQSEMKSCVCPKIPRLREKLRKWQVDLKPALLKELKEREEYEDEKSSLIRISTTFY